MTHHTPRKFAIGMIGILALMLSISVYLLGSAPAALAQSDPTASPAAHDHNHASPAEADLPSQMQELQTEGQNLSMPERMERMMAMMDGMKAKMDAMHGEEHVMDPAMHESMMAMMEGMMAMSEGMMAEMMEMPMAERMEAMPSMMGMMGRMMQMMGMMQKHESGDASGMMNSMPMTGTLSSGMQEKMDGMDMKGMMGRMSGMMSKMGGMMAEDAAPESDAPTAAHDHDHGAATATPAAEHDHGAATATPAAEHDHSATTATPAAEHDHSATTATPSAHDHGATAPTEAAASTEAAPAHDHSSAPSADNPHAGHHPPIPAQGVDAASESTGGQPLAFTEEDGVKVFELTAKPIRWTILDAAEGKAVVTAWSYNGTVPGPMIRVTEGDPVRIILKNELPEATSIHWHGMPVPNEMDGMTAIQPGESFAYEFTAPAAGTYMYHSHRQTDKQVMVGLYAPFIVDPQEAEADPPAVDVMWMLSEWRIGEDGETYPAMPMSGLEPNYFTINGKAYPNIEPIEVKKGERVRVRLAAIGQFAHPMHLHGMNFRVVGYDGVSLPPAQQMVRNTITVNPGEIVDIEFVADNVGSWMLHCHIPHHLTNNHVEPGGLIGMVEVVE